MSKKAKELAELTGVSVSVATTMLEKYKTMDRAADAILSRSESTPTSMSPSKIRSIEAVFKKYADSATGEIGMDGTVSFIQDLGLGVEDPAVLALAYELGAKNMGQFESRGFVDGWTALGASTMAEMKVKTTALKTKLHTDETYFTKVYRFTFTFILSDGQRVLPLDIAMAYWSLLLAPRFPLCDQWLTFVTIDYNKSISKDTWNMVWDFAKYQRDDPDLKAYDDEGAWPSIIDEFVLKLKST